MTEGRTKHLLSRLLRKGDRRVESESHLGPTLRLSPTDLQQSESSNKVIGCDHRGGGEISCRQASSALIQLHQHVAKGEDSPSAISRNTPFPSPSQGKKATEMFSQLVGGNVLWKIRKQQK